MCIYHLNKLFNKINRAKKEITDMQPSTPSPIKRTDLEKPISLATFIVKIYSQMNILILVKIAISKKKNNDEKYEKLISLELKNLIEIREKLLILYQQLELDEDSSEDMALKIFYYKKLLRFWKKIDDVEECKCDKMFTLVEPTKEIILFKAVNFFDTFENFDEM